ncbi:Ent-kaurene oxidase [Cyphellophora attinorum]|uniref:Ent-kaurene oxidase n=1 Tax=Cyphellophora attinorum TaxID=1664694 RepID=A0A0N1HS04_9EURO|nr:Ent-kaurene oxidase [Phialophora attinorum]KPI41256.1 Ent-kaurene oxidase [Phialophora attinorum]
MSSYRKTATLTRSTPNLIPVIYDEVAVSSDEDWGTNANWHEVNVYNAVQHIIARASNRVFVGQELCRNEEMLKVAQRWSVLFPISGMILRQIPELLRPLVAPLITSPNHWYARRFIKYLKPEILRRQSATAADSKEKPNDFMQWTIDAAERSDLEAERSPRIIALRILATIFGTIHTSTFITSNIVLDLASCDPENLSEIRQEIRDALVNNDNKWDKSLVQRLVKLDSSMRESARLRTFTLTNVLRRVVNPKGLVTPDGAKLPYGALIGLPTMGIHNDEDIYKDAANEKPTGKSGSNNAGGRSFVSVSPKYHPFGLGRHACPGRFFASAELRLLLAYLVLNYDIEHQPERVAPQYVGTVLLPPSKATVRVRRIAK